MKSVLTVLLCFSVITSFGQTYLLKTIAGTDSLYLKFNEAGQNTDSLFRRVNSVYIFAHKPKIKSYTTFLQLLNKPTTIAGYGIIDASSISHTHAYNTITGAPSLFDGNYNSLINKPTIPDVTGKVNYSDTATMLLAYKNAIETKQPSLGFTPYNSTNPNGYINSVPAQTFNSLTGKPTTRAGYGIIDAAADNHTHTPASIGAEPTITVLAFAKGGISASAATSATTGTMTVNMTSSIITITPTGACTFNASGGVAGQIVTFSITTSGVSSFVLTFGTNFRKTGTLATGTTSARFFTVTFRCLDGTIWSEIGRTAAQT